MHQSSIKSGDPNAIVIKTCLNDDIRRFSVTCSQQYTLAWSQFVDTVSKLYNVDASRYKMTYKDEENDDVVISSNEELMEAFDVARRMRPAALRLALTTTATATATATTTTVAGATATTATARAVGENQPTGSNLTNVIRSFAPSSPTERLPCGEEGLGCTKDVQAVTSPACTRAGVTSCQGKGVSKTSVADSRSSSSDVPIVYIAGKPFMPSTAPTKPSYGCTKVPQPPPTETTTPTFTTTAPPHPSSLRALTNLTNSISDSVSSNVMHSSDLTLQASTNASNSTLYTQSISDATLHSNLEIGTQMTLLAHQLSHQSISDPLTDTVANLSRISNDTGKTSSNASDWTVAMVLDRSLSVHDDIAPVSQSTMQLQHNATLGMERERDRNVDMVVKSIMSVTPSW